MFRAIKGVAHDDLAQFGPGVHIAEHAVEQVEQSLQIVMGIATPPCRYLIMRGYVLLHSSLAGKTGSLSGSACRAGWYTFSQISYDRVGDRQMVRKRNLSCSSSMMNNAFGQE